MHPFQVTVKFQTIPGTAEVGIDYSVTSTDVILYDGETTKPLPLEVINDQTPEVAESFRVILLEQITGGAVLGSPDEAEVIIQQSDDPYGNFGKLNDFKKHELYRKDHEMKSIHVFWYAMLQIGKLYPQVLLSRKSLNFYWRGGAIAQLVEQWSRNPATSVRNQGDALVLFGKVNPHYQVSQRGPKSVCPLVAY